MCSYKYYNTHPPIVKAETGQLRRYPSPVPGLRQPDHRPDRSLQLFDHPGHSRLPVNATTEDLDNVPLSTVQGFKQLALPWYADQCLPFDITIAAANEYGAAASAKLFGVEILNEGFGTSVDDSVLEQQATFIARSVLPLQAVGRTSLITA